MLIPLVVWSWGVELLLPTSGVLGRLCVSDHRGILYHALGALGAGVFWSRWHGSPPGPPADPAAAPQLLR